jgi:DNA modification methylase
MKIETLQTTTLIPYARNTRTHSEAQVAQIAGSIREFGFTNPILIDAENGIIAGHGRVMAAQKLGLDKVPCIRLGHLTDTQRRAYIIADNKLALNAGWDEEMLELELAALKSEDFDLSLIGFDESELCELMAETTEGETDPDDVPEPPIDPVTVPSDVWVMGKHRLMCGDSTSIDSVQKLMNGSQADLVWTDPPYNVALGMNETPEEAKRRNRRTDGLTVMNDELTDSDFKQFLLDVYSSFYSVMKEGACIYVAHSDSERVNFTQSFKDSGFKLSQILIWVKQSGALSRQDFNWQHEPIIYGWKEGAAHYFCGDFTRTTVIDDDVSIKDMKKEQLVELIKEMRAGSKSTALRHDRPTKSDLHPTMKPVSLVQRMIEWSSRPSETVLDLFGGSGSTMIACHKTGRHARLMELDPKYCDVIVKRWQDFAGKQAIHEASGKTFDEMKAAKP